MTEVRRRVYSRRIIKHRRFHPLERRVFCRCELCRLPFRRMLYNTKKSGEPLRSYRPGGEMKRRADWAARRFASGRMRDAPPQSLARDDAPLGPPGQRGRR